MPIEHLNENPIPFLDKKITLSPEQLENTYSVVTVVIKEGKILSINRNYKYTDDGVGTIVPFEGYDYGLPGGVIDSGEVLEAAGLRELHEETGIDGRDPFPVFAAPSHPQGKRLCTALVVSSFSGEITPVTNEGQAEWVKPAILLNPNNTYFEYNAALLQYLELE